MMRRTVAAIIVVMALAGRAAAQQAEAIDFVLRPVLTLPAWSEPVRCVAVAPDGSTFGISAGRETGFIATAGKRLVGRLRGTANDLLYLDKDRVAMCQGQVVYIYNVSENKPEQRLEAAADELIRLAWHPGSGRLAALGQSGRVTVWPLAKPEERTSFGSSRGSAAIAFGGNGDLVATASADGVRIFDLAERKEVLRRPLLGGGKTLDIGPHGRYFAGSGHPRTTADRCISLWQTGDGKLRRLLVGHPEKVRLVRFLGNGTAILSVGEGGTVCVWPTAGPATGGRPVRRIGLERLLTDVELSADQHFLISVDTDHVVQLHRLGLKGVPPAPDQPAAGGEEPLDIDRLLDE